jgi:hypothetical protein
MKRDIEELRALDEIRHSCERDTLQGWELVLLVAASVVLWQFGYQMVAVAMSILTMLVLFVPTDDHKIKWKVQKLMLKKLRAMEA